MNWNHSKFVEIRHNYSWMGSYQMQMCKKHFCVFKVKTKLNKGQDMDYHNTWFDLSYTHGKMEWSGVFVENSFVRICRHTFGKALLRVGAGGRISFPRSISTRKSEAVRTSGSTMYYRHLHHCHHRRHHRNPCRQERRTPIKAKNMLSLNNL